MSNILQFRAQMTTEKGGNYYTIQDVKYPGRPVFISRLTKAAGTAGHRLENRRGFPFRMQPPFACFKALRAMYAAGVGTFAQGIIQRKHRSWITLDHLWDGVQNYSYPTKPRYNSKHYTKAKEMLKDEFKVEDKIPMCSWGVSYKNMPKSTSAGLPYIQEGIQSKEQAIRRDAPRMINFWDRVGRGLKVPSLPDCAAFARSHIGSVGENKVRPVWAYPVAAVWAEGRIAGPLIRELTSQNIGHHTAYGMEMMKGGMAWVHDQALRINAKRPGTKWCMTDFSSFDSTVPAWLIKDCFDILKQKIDFSKETQLDGSIKDVNPKHGLRMFKKLQSYFINTTIRNPDGKRFRKDHGIPSGSMFTNVIDTMVNMIVSRTLYLETFGTLPTFDLYFGDDALAAFDNKTIINMNDLSYNATLLFGMTISTKKSFYTENIQNIHFLGYYNNLGTPFKPDEELLASLVFPQYIHEDWAYVVSRSLGCLLASAGNSSNIFQACRGVYNLAKRQDNDPIGRGIELIKENSRMKRFITVLGCNDLILSDKYFMNQRMSIPKNNCKKIELQIDLTKHL